MRVNPFLVSFVALVVCPGIVLAQGGTELSFQGRLLDAGAPANGNYDVTIRLYDDVVGGTEVGLANTFSGLGIIDGLFTVELDFGADAFDNQDRWLEIEVDGTPLAPRQAVTRTPYAIQTRGIFVNEDGQVGVGTDDPDFPLHIEDGGINAGAIVAHSVNTFGGSFTSESISGYGVYGSANAPTGFTYGVYGRSNSDLGHGVFGYATAPSGENYGGWFETESTGGRGVFGYANATSGTNYGGRFESDSSEGRGVFGRANSAIGATIGGRFESISESGVGVFGKAEATSGNTYGGKFEVESTTGVGVMGEARANTGYAVGVRGLSRSDGGVGVLGQASIYGVYGQSSSADGVGVFGHTFISNGGGYGVYGLTAGSSGRGVFGMATSTSGVTYGGRFESRSSSGFAGYFEGAGNDAVYIENTSDGRGLLSIAPLDTAVWARTTSGFAGIHAENDGASGRAVYGEANSSSGTNFGVYGKSNSASGYDFYAGGAGVNYGASSSRRWKKNVVVIGDPLKKINQLRGVYFDWDEQHGGAHDIGMIAEEVGAVLPEVVQYEANGVDASGMDYSKMTPLLVEAVKALQTEKNREIQQVIAEKDAQIEALQERLESLEQRVEQLAAPTREKHQ